MASIYDMRDLTGGQGSAVRFPPVILWRQKLRCGTKHLRSVRAF